MKRFVGYVIDKAVKALPRKKKVSPDIKSVEPTKLPVSKSIKKTKQDEFRNRYTALDKAEGKLKTGKQMMKEGQKERKKLVDTGRAVQFKHTKTFTAINPGTKDRFKGLTKEEKPKKFKTAKQMEKDERRKRDREPFMGGGMMGRRMGYSQGSNGKPISRSKNPGILAMSKTAKGRKVVKERFKFNPDRIVAKKGGKA